MRETRGTTQGDVYETAVLCEGWWGWGIGEEEEASVLRSERGREQKFENRHKWGDFRGERPRRNEGGGGEVEGKCGGSS